MEQEVGVLGTDHGQWPEQRETLRGTGEHTALWSISPACLLGITATPLELGQSQDHKCRLSSSQGPGKWLSEQMSQKASWPERERRPYQDRVSEQQ